MGLTRNIIYIEILIITALFLTSTIIPVSWIVTGKNNNHGLFTDVSLVKKSTVQL
jgi:hypothetical protein